MNLPNKLTMMRVVLVPVFMILPPFPTMAQRTSMRLIC